MIRSARRDNVTLYCGLKLSMNVNLIAILSYRIQEDSALQSVSTKDHFPAVSIDHRPLPCSQYQPKTTALQSVSNKDHCPAVSINQTVMPQVESVKYLGLHFDLRLNWKQHIAKK